MSVGEIRSQIHVCSSTMFDASRVIRLDRHAVVAILVDALDDSTSG